MLYRDEDSILKQLYEKQTFSAFYSEDLKFFRVIGDNAYIMKYSSLQLRTHKIGF